ncbi:MAG: MDR family MFS transporter [Eggerthellaceae bacterium]|nr:MDR family MFS transporter [Eggerthellaceae bacterium]
MKQTEPTTLPVARVRVDHPYLALMGLYLGGFTGMYSETALNIALPQLSIAFGIDIALTQWLVIGYMLVIGLVLPFSSLLMKWFPARGITLFALGAFFVGSFVSGCAPGFEVALAGRAVQGVGTGLILPLLFAMTLEVVPPHKIGAAMGVSGLVVMVAPAVGPTLAGLLIELMSWRLIFFSFAAILLAGVPFVLKFGVSPYEITKPAIDAPSVAASCLGFGGVVLGVGLASLCGWLSVPTLGSLVVGVVALAAYAKRQLAMENPVLDLGVFRIRGFLVGTLCVMLNFGITLSAMYILPQFYQNALLLAVAFTGIVMLPGGIVNAVVSLISGRIYDRVGAKGPALVGFGLSAVAAVLLLFATPASPLGYVVACHVVMMVGVPLAMSPCQTHALSSLPPELSGDGSAVLNTLQQVLGAVCTAIATLLLTSGQAANLAAGVDGVSAFAAGSHWGFVFTLVLAGLGLACSLMLKGRVRGAAQEPENADAPSMTIARIMETDVYTLTESASALDALRLFVEKGISGAPVVNEAGKLTGFINDGDIVGALAKQDPTFVGFYAVAADPTGSDFKAKSEALSSMSVGRLATRNVLTARVDDDLDDVCVLLAMRHLKKAPVMDGDDMVGIVNRADITRHIAEMYVDRA